MKKVKFLAMLMFAMSACFAFTACSDDDDDDGGGSGGGNGVFTVTGGTSKSGFNYGTWHIEEGGTRNAFYSMEFYTFDIYSALTNGDFSVMGRGFSVVYIDLNAPAGASVSATSLPTGEFAPGDYRVYSAFNISGSAAEGSNQYEKVSGTGNGNLVITENGGKYTVSIAKMKVVDNNGDSSTFYSGSFSFTGTMRLFDPNEYGE